MGEKDKMRSVALISGGLDSAVTAHIIKDLGEEIYALSFDYGQRHKRELDSAKKIASSVAAIEHKILMIDLDQIGGSALTDDIAVPFGKSADEIGKDGKIPATYVPARNTIFLSYALSYAEVIDAQKIYIGANHLDFSGYPDCRPKYFEAFQTLADLATKKGVEGQRITIETPIIKLNKAQIIRKGIDLGVPFEDTTSCYVGGENACGRCESCTLRLKGFMEAGISDPIVYEI